MDAVDRVLLDSKDLELLIRCFCLLSVFPAFFQRSSNVVLS